MVRIIKCAGKRPSPEAIQAAVSVISQEGVVAIPTETFYGLAAHPFSERALAKIFSLKRRPPEKPLLLLIGEVELLAAVAREIPPLAKTLIKRFWPGPLTLIFPAQEHLPQALTAGTGTVAVRLSPHPIPREISRLLGSPITGTSANLSGAPPASTALEVAQSLPGVDLILDAGKTPGQAASTIVDVTGAKPRLVRKGVISWEEIKAYLGTKGQREDQ